MNKLSLVIALVAGLAGLAVANKIQNRHGFRQQHFNDGEEFGECEPQVCLGGLGGLGGRFPNGVEGDDEFAFGFGPQAQGHGHGHGHVQTHGQTHGHRHGQAHGHGHSHGHGHGQTHGHGHGHKQVHGHGHGGQAGFGQGTSGWGGFSQTGPEQNGFGQIGFGQGEFGPGSSGQGDFGGFGHGVHHGAKHHKHGRVSSKHQQQLGGKQSGGFGGKRAGPGGRRGGAHIAGNVGLGGGQGLHRQFEASGNDLAATGSVRGQESQFGGFGSSTHLGSHDLAEVHKASLVGGNKQFETGIQSGDLNENEAVHRHQVLNKDKTIIKDRSSGVNDVDGFRHTDSHNEGAHIGASSSVVGAESAGGSLRSDKEFDHDFGAVAGSESSAEADGTIRATQ